MSADPILSTHRLPDGRVLAFDDVGDPHGAVVLYLHGMPDCRLARHPDDELAAALSVRLLAVDRPGYGGSSVDPDATLGSVAADLGHLLDALGVASVGVLAWSAGAPYALALAAARPTLVRSVAIAAGLPTRDGRPDLLELLVDLRPDELAAEVAELLVPDPQVLDLALAREHLADTSDPIRAREVASVPGAEEQLAEALVAAVGGGLDGLRRDLEVLASVPDVDVFAYGGPVRLLYGERDSLAPPTYGTWLAERLPDATLTVVPGAGHAVALVHWADLLGGLR